MSASSVTIQIPGQAIAAAVRQRREARQLERTALRERRIAHHARSLSERTIGASSLNVGSAAAKLVELKARRDLLDGAPRATIDEVESELKALETGGCADEAERMIEAAEERLERSWEQQASQEAAIEAFDHHPWCSVEEGSVERSEGRLRLRLSVDDGRSMPAWTDVARGENRDDDVLLSVQVAGAGIHEVETPSGVAVGCDAEIAYVSKLAADSGIGATVRPDPEPGFGVAVDLRSRSVGQ